MKVLVLGGTRFFGIHMVNALIHKGHDVTIATRGRAKDSFENHVQRLVVERTDPESLAQALGNRTYDVICDNVAYCSNDVKALLDHCKCGRYVMTSSVSVYTDLHENLLEDEFNPAVYPLKWCSRQEYPYSEVKRQAECALFQCYPEWKAAAVRFPYVIGEDDYTQRLLFYVEQIIKEKPINSDNLDANIGFIHSTEAGLFLSWIAEQTFVGPINAGSAGTVTLREIIEYVEQKTGKKALCSKDGSRAPYNGHQSISVDTGKARRLGYSFTELKPWIYQLVDSYINRLV